MKLANAVLLQTRLRARSAHFLLLLSLPSIQTLVWSCRTRGESAPLFEGAYVVSSCCGPDTAAHLPRSPGHSEPRGFQLSYVNTEQALAEFTKRELSPPQSASESREVAFTPEVIHLINVQAGTFG